MYQCGNALQSTTARAKCPWSSKNLETEFSKWHNLGTGAALLNRLVSHKLADGTTIWSTPESVWPAPISLLRNCSLSDIGVFPTGKGAKVPIAVPYQPSYKLPKHLLHGSRQALLGGDGVPEISIPEMVTELRGALGLTQEQFTARVGVTRIAIKQAAQ